MRVTANGVLLEPSGGATPAAAAGPQSAPAPASRLSAPGVAAELDGVSKAHGERVVLDGVSAAFAPGTLTAISGRSGSGKSTLLHLLAGLDRPDAGDVVVGGASLAGRSRAWLADLRQRSVGVLGQDGGLAGFLSAAEEVALPMLLAGAHGAEATARAAQWLAALGLTERTHQRTARLSAGERQRVALAAGRGLLLVDEPTSRLDAANAAGLADLLRTVAHKHGATVVCATHDPIVRERAAAVLSLDPAAAEPAPLPRATA